MRENLEQGFDFVVVGGGTAGCVLAARLSEEPHRRVCLIEAGGSGKSLFVRIPGAIVLAQRSASLNWRFQTVPQPRCAQALKNAKLQVATCSLSAESADGKLLVIERFDRNGERALHFEEFCSLMGMNSVDKYKTTYEQLATSINRFIEASSRQTAVTALFRALVCDRLTGNAAAHMKNFGVLCTSYQDIGLAPFYDAVCTRAFEDVPPGVLMGGKGSWWNHATLVGFGRYCGLSARDAEGHIEDVCAAVEETLPEIDTARERYAHFNEIGDRMTVLWKHALEEIRGKRAMPRPKVKYALLILPAVTCTRNAAAPPRFATTQHATKWL